MAGDSGFSTAYRYLPFPVGISIVATPTSNKWGSPCGFSSLGIKLQALRNANGCCATEPPALNMALILQWSFLGLVDICLPSLDLLPTSELVVGFLDVCLDQICDFSVSSTACSCYCLSAGTVLLLNQFACSLAAFVRSSAMKLFSSVCFMVLLSWFLCVVYL